MGRFNCDCFSVFMALVSVWFLFLFFHSYGVISSTVNNASALHVHYSPRCLMKKGTFSYMATHTIHPMTNTWTNGRTDCVHNSMHPSKQDVQILWMCEKVWHLLRFRQLIGNLKKMASHTNWRRAHLLTVFSSRYKYLPSFRNPAGILWWTLFTLFEPSNRLGMNVLHWKFWFNEPDTDAFFFCTCYIV